MADDPVQSTVPEQPAPKRFHLVSLRKLAEDRGTAWIDLIKESNEEVLTADGFESCVLGVANRYGMDPVVAYDYDKCIDVLVQRGMSYETAVEYFEFNVTGAWMGPGTPVFVSMRYPG